MTPSSREPNHLSSQTLWRFQGSATLNPSPGKAGFLVAAAMRGGVGDDSEAPLFYTNFEVSTLISQNVFTNQF